MAVVETSRTDRGVVTLTINRPEKKNALDRATWLELIQQLDHIADRRDDRVVVITGSGDAFCAGADLGGEPGGPESSMGSSLHTMRRLVGRCALRLYELPQPTIAAVNGVAAGAGCNLALGCDLAIAADTARFSEIFSKRGLTLDFAGSWVLPRLIGLRRAKELAFFGDMVSAHDAHRMGLVNDVVGADALERVAAERADRLASYPPMQLSIIKRQLNQSFSMSLSETIELEGLAQALSGRTSDAGEARRAFLEHREPTFRGE